MMPDFTRDAEFDLEHDEERCLHGLATPNYNRFTPCDVQRVSNIFDNPRFIAGGTYSPGLVQGRYTHWWFLSALTAATASSLVETSCVAVSFRVLIKEFN